MKYRIKKITYKDGEVLYFAQYYKNWFSGWKGIDKDGDKYHFIEDAWEFKSKEEALKAIGLTDKGKRRGITVEFENITK